DRVIRGVYGDEALGEPGESLGGEGERLGIAVDPHDREGGEGLQEQFAVPPEPECRVDDHGGRCCLDRWPEQLDAPRRHHRYVNRVRRWAVQVCLAWSEVEWDMFLVRPGLPPPGSGAGEVRQNRGERPRLTWTRGLHSGDHLLGELGVYVLLGEEVVLPCLGI